MPSSRKAPKKGAGSSSKKTTKKSAASRKAAPKKAATKKSAPKKAATKKSATTKGPAKKKAAPAKKAPAKKPPAREPPAPVAPEPEFVKRASAAERKAAMEALAQQEGLDEAANAATGAPAPLPPAVREASPADRKAAVEKMVEESGVATVLAKAPWKRRKAEPEVPETPPTSAPPAEERRQPRVAMTQAPMVQEEGRSAPKVVLLDTNALMMQFQFHVDVEREVQRILGGNYEIMIPDVVLGELERLSKEGTTKEQAEARMAVELAKTFPIEEAPGDGDTAILRLADKLNAIVVTNDKVLRARLRAKDIPNIYMRSRAFLTIEGHIPGM